MQYSADKGFERSVEGHAFGVNLGMMYSAETDKAVSSVAKGVVDLLDGFGKAFGRNGKYEIATGFADDSSKDGAWGTLRISRDGKDLVNWEDNRQSRWAAREFADGPEGYKQYLAAVAKGYAPGVARHGPAELG